MPIPPQNPHPYLVLVVLMVSAVGFAAVPLTLAWLWAKFYSPKKPGHDKNAIYECGLEAKGDAWIHFKAEYYLYAIIFLVFDVETIFLLLLVEGLVWAWQKGVLNWK